MTDSQAIINDNANEYDSHSIVDVDFSEYYADFYIIEQNKSEAYKKACIATGYPVPDKYLNQYAYSYHKRIDRDGYVQKALQRAVNASRIKAHNKIDQLRDNASSESIQFQAAKLQSESLYNKESEGSGIEVHVNRDNVQIKAGKDTLTIENVNGIKEIE